MFRNGKGLLETHDISSNRKHGLFTKTTDEKLYRGEVRFVALFLSQLTRCTSLSKFVWPVVALPSSAFYRAGSRGTVYIIWVAERPPTASSRYPFFYQPHFNQKPACSRIYIVLFSGCRSHSKLKIQRFCATQHRASHERLLLKWRGATIHPSLRKISPEKSGLSRKIDLEVRLKISFRS